MAIRSSFFSFLQLLIVRPLRLDLLCFTLLPISCFFFSNLVAAEPASQQIRFGVLLPLTGDLANYGDDALRVIELALEDLAANPEYRAFSFSAIFEDGKCQGRAALTAARKLISQDQVTAIIAPGCSSEVLAAAPAVQQSQTVLVASFASSPDISNAGDFIFRICPSDLQGGKELVGLLRNDKRKRLAILTENNDYTLAIDRVVKADLKEAKIELVSAQYFNNDLNDFRPLLLKVRGARPDAVLLNPLGGARAGLLLRQLLELGIKSAIYGTYTYSAPDTVEAAGGVKNLEGLKFIDAPALQTDKANSLLERFIAQFSKPQSNFHVVFTYDMVSLLAQSIKTVGTAGPALRDHLLQLPNYEGLSHSYRFDSNGDVIGVPYGIYEYRDGKIVELVRNRE